MCARPIEDEHSHVVNIETRRLNCACRACYLLFSADGAGAGKMRQVPARYRSLAGFALDRAGWERLQIPVHTAFFFENSHLGKFVAFYPSPAGATESLLGLEAWQEIVDANPVLGEMLPDVEALLVHGPRDRPFQSFIVPVNACYELVGRVRQSWRGFDGGEAAWQEIDEFFAGVRARAAESP
jgi:hypothetical protein